MKVYVTRHGLTQWNAIDRISGITDIALTQEGLAQAQEMAAKAACIGGIERILASPMQRAQATAQAAAQALSLPVETDVRLREWDYGSFEGQSRHTPGFPEAKAAWGCKMPGGGESVFQIVQRTYNVLDDVRAAGKVTLIVCHGGICRVIDSYFHDMTLERFMGFFMGNCEIREYEFT